MAFPLATKNDYEKETKGIVFSNLLIIIELQKNSHFSVFGQKSTSLSPRGESAKLSVKTNC
jgi:hypothetical protein